jgi:hypothetical protein
MWAGWILLMAGTGIAAFRFIDFGAVLILFLVLFLVIGLGMITRRRLLRLVMMNLAVFVSFLILTEAVFVIREYRTSSGERRVHLHNVYASVKHPVFGWTLVKNTSEIWSKSIGSESVYRCRVTVDSNGLRVSPASNAADPEAVLFFGNSCTFGEGVDDSLTLPYQFGTMKSDRYQVYNFGVSGYGPHHMLAQLESGFVDEVVQEPVKHIILQVLYPEHVYRILGYYEWNSRSPEYKPDSLGYPVFKGLYCDNRTPATGLRFWKYSATLRYLHSRNAPLSRQDKELFAGIILKAKQYTDRQFNHPEFHLLLWDWSDGGDASLFDQLRKAGIQIHDAKSIFPGDPASPKFRISRWDTHPNALAYKLMAEFLMEHADQGPPPVSLHKHSQEQY